MSSTETAESTNREIQVEIPAEEVARTTATLIEKYQKLARLPGFRRGHVPPSIIRQRFSEDIKSEVVETLVPRYFRQEAEKKGWVPVSQPRVTDLHIHDGEPLTFKASFEILPEVKVEGYKDLRADKPEITVTDAEVDETLNGLREQHAAAGAVLRLGRYLRRAERRAVRRARPQPPMPLRELLHLRPRRGGSLRRKRSHARRNTGSIRRGAPALRDENVRPPR